MRVEAPLGLRSRVFYHSYSATYLTDKMRRASFWLLCVATYGTSAFVVAASLVWLFQLMMGA